MNALSDPNTITHGVTAIITLCAVIAAFWRPDSNSPLYPLYTLINAIGQNYNKAANDPAIQSTADNSQKETP